MVSLKTKDGVTFQVTTEVQKISNYLKNNLPKAKWIIVLV